MIQNSILNGLGVSYVALDATGSIVEVSAKWKGFGEANGADSAAIGIGANYLDVCLRSIATSPDAQPVQSVPAGEARARRPRHNPGNSGHHRRPPMIDEGASSG